MSLRGKRALITGASGKIGHQIAITFAELGADLVLVDRPGQNFDELLVMLEKIGNIKIECVECDLEDGNARTELINHLLSQDEVLNILVNNAAFVGEPKLEGWITGIENQSIEAWRREIEVNLTAAFDLAKGLLPKLKKNKNGSIINVASIYAVSGPDYSLYEGTDMGNNASYAASKGGLVQLTRWLSTTLAPDVRVNVISPGGVFRNQPAEFVKRYEAKTPLGRMATEEDFKGAVAYLGSELSAYVTGQNLIIDGGWTVW
jgi:NAD(P)-dependent dehydrogenase (short-subunit alcohol dehydrogenase family)